MTKRREVPKIASGSAEDDWPAQEDAVDRRRVLKAGVGLAASAAALAAGGAAFAQEVPSVDVPTSHLPIPEPVQGVGEQIFCHEQSPGHICGSIGEGAAVEGNTVEIVVPSGREVRVQHLKEGEQPLAEVVVRISEEIRRNARAILVATAIPVPVCC